MKALPKKLWLEELDAQEQDKGALRTKHGYCCLGVLCEAYRKATGKGRWGSPRWNPPGVSDDEEAHYAFETEGSVPEAAVLPEAVKRWAGLKVKDPRVRARRKSGLKGHCALSTLNDGGCGYGRRNFAEIKELIREQL